MDTPDDAFDIDTVASTLIETMPRLSKTAAAKMSKAVLAVMYDAGWRKHETTTPMKPPAELLVRWSLYDAFDKDTPESLGRAIGMNPISEELQVMERRASQRRLARLSGITDFVANHASFFANVYIGVQRQQAHENSALPDFPERYWDSAEDQMAVMLQSTCMSLLATLYGLDIVQEGKGEVLHGI